ncbi:hypothetical protein BJ508DRAFT_332912 [Ascobolus immersus RN42]|uniref:Uncharacterized protein n=1 Tax=Ascobolus immersus RN42 TaxID=1160509 RepID=A0A3N4HLD1_ASCIM|nr:hypothetical protein BJ508DRAFT_332912 [Ascobolus immersus RN42]
MKTSRGRTAVLHQRTHIKPSLPANPLLRPSPFRTEESESNTFCFYHPSWTAQPEHPPIKPPSIPSQTLQKARKASCTLLLFLLVPVILAHICTLLSREIRLYVPELSLLGLMETVVRMGMLVLGFEVVRRASEYVGREAVVVWGFGSVLLAGWCPCWGGVGEVRCWGNERVVKVLLMRSRR